MNFLLLFYYYFVLSYFMSQHHILSYIYVKSVLSPRSGLRNHVPLFIVPQSNKNVTHITFVDLTKRDKYYPCCFMFVEVSHTTIYLISHYILIIINNQRVEADSPWRRLGNQSKQ